MLVQGKLFVRLQLKKELSEMYLHVKAQSEANVTSLFSLQTVTAMKVTDIKLPSQ
jgi:hypothetical protein